MRVGGSAPSSLGSGFRVTEGRCDGSAYLSHAELVRKTRGAEMPKNLYHEPLSNQGGSHVLSGPHDPILAADGAWGNDIEAEIPVVTDDVPMGVSGFCCIEGRALSG